LLKTRQPPTISSMKVTFCTMQKTTKDDMSY
jgi:hypothetical protein